MALSLPLIAELQRRRVFRALVGYGIAAFAILQIIEPVMHGLHWSEGVLTYVVVGLAIGFPAVVGLAWIFDVNGGRVERTPPAESPGGLRGARLALVLAGIGALAAAPGLAWYFFLRPASGTARAPSIAVLPFVNLGGGQESEYFSDGMTEELIDALANIEGLRVVARTSAFAYKGKNVNIRQIGEELNVATVLEGSVRRRGNQLRVVAQLIGAADGYHLWSKTYDRDLQNLFAVEDEVVRAIVQALKPRLVRGPALVQQATASSEAHDLYLRGRYFWNQRNKEGLKKAQALLEQAIALDPGYALAHSGLADCYSLFKDYGQAMAAEVLPKAKAHALKAVELDEALAEGHASLGLLGMDDYQWDLAERELKRAIELRPAYASAHQWLALALRSTGRAAESRAEAEKALQLDPTSMIINHVVAIGFFFDRDYERAIAQDLKAVDLSPAADLPRYVLARSYDQLGRFAEALAVLDQAPAQSAWVRCTRARVLAASGERAAAQRLLAEVEKRLPEDPVPPGVLADAHLALGDKDRAFEWLERGVEERDQMVPPLMVAPQFDSIRADPRYHQLLKRMNLE